jgi:pyruvate/2-oxoacid:ferredoxin oxidoreductase alpha subunit
LTLIRRAGQDGFVQMTDGYASAVTVSIPIFVLAAGAEARAVRERLKRPDENWEREFADYRAEHDPVTATRPSEMLRYYRGVPWVSKLYLTERLVAVAAAVAWLVVFVLLAIAELRCLVWLADGARPGNSGLASFSLLSIAIAMAALILAPAAYLLVPLALPLDIIPKGLRDDVKSKLNQEKSKGFFKMVLSELEGALDRAGDKFAEEAGGGAPPAIGQDPASEPEPP